MQVNVDRFSWFQVPANVKQLLILATQTWNNTEESKKYMQQALTIADNDPEVLVASYRYFYYKNNYVLALLTAKKLIAKIEEMEDLPNNWQQLKPILVRRQEEPQIRLYLSAYVASGLLLAKLGSLEEAMEIGTQIRDIDIKDKFGADILLNILTTSSTKED